MLTVRRINVCAAPLRALRAAVVELCADLVQVFRDVLFQLRDQRFVARVDGNFVHESVPVPHVRRLKTLLA